MEKDINLLASQLKNVSSELAELLALGYQLELSTSKNGYIKVYKMKKRHHVLNLKDTCQATGV